jgi:uncharacterized protein YPO0396
MLIGVISDTHNNLTGILEALDFFLNEKVDVIFHCGDWTSPDTVKLFAVEAHKRGMRVYGVLGNNDEKFQDEIKKINETSRTIHFGEDSYEFVFPKSIEFSIFYDMVTSDFNESESGLLSLDFEMKYNEQLEELFASLAQDELNSNGALNRFTDYRTYMDYDIKIHNNVTGTETFYSQVFKEKSGGETQVPFYVAIIASFVRIYTRNTRVNNDSIGLILFDEVFDKMDGRRMKSMMQFINSMPVQILLACPSSRLKDLAPYTETTIVTLRNGEQAQILNLLSKDVVEGNV